MAKVFKIHEADTAFPVGCWEKTSFVTELPDAIIPPKQKYVYLFMIGGSGASIISPFIYFFYQAASRCDYIVKPIFVERNFDSEIVSNAINTIGEFRKICQFKLCESKIGHPYFFYEKNLDCLEKNNVFLDICSGISETDKAYISFSVYNNENIRVKDYIVKCIRKQSEAEIHCSLFLPYFRLLGQTEASVQNQIANNLRASGQLENKEYMTIIGLPALSVYERAAYQCNPFNMVSLISASNLLRSMQSSPNDANGIYEYSINFQDVLYVKDIIGDKQFRDGLIYADMRCLLWSYLRKINNQTIEQISDVRYRFIDLFLGKASQMLSDLCDMTYHNAMAIRFRKRIFDTSSLNLLFNDSGFFKIRRMSEKDFSLYFDSLINPESTVNENMIISQVLLSIDKLITGNFEDIQSLYY